MKTGKYCARIVRELWRAKKSILLGNFGNNMISAVKPYIYLIFPAWILNALISHQDLYVIIGLIIVGVFFNGILLWLSNWLENINLENGDYCSMIEKNQITRKLMKMDYSVFEEKKSAESIARHRSETKERGGVYYNFLRFMHESMTAITKIMVSGIVLGPFWPILFINTGTDFWGSAGFSWLVICGMIGAWILLTKVKEKMNQKIRVLRNQYSEIDQVYETYRDEISKYQTGKEIRIFQMQSFIMQEATSKLLGEGKRLQRKMAWSRALGDSAGYAIFIVLSFCFYLIIGNKMLLGYFSIGDAVIYAGAFVQLLEGFRRGASSLGEVKDIEVRAKTYFDILDTKKTSEEVPEDGMLEKGQEPAFRFQNVWFGYQEEDVIKGVNLEIRSKEKVAIVGENGSGKSTLIKLLCGLYQPRKGKILCNGRDIRQYPSNEYQKLFAVVFQDFSLYAYALGENVAVKSEYNQQEVSNLLKQVDFPEKYGLGTILYQECDPEGVNISGGEAQKVALARAIHLQAPVVIMDEPTSAMDPFAEMKLYHQLETMSKEKTAIYISHRLSSCRFCDRIIVLDQGRIVQSGTHEELLQDTEGKYFALWNAQAQFFL